MGSDRKAHLLFRMGFFLLGFGSILLTCICIYFRVVQKRKNLNSPHHESEQYNDGTETDCEEQSDLSTIAE